jgi:hypothetical protein
LFCQHLSPFSPCEIVAYRPRELILCNPTEYADIVEYHC